MSFNRYFTIGILSAAIVLILCACSLTSGIFDNPALRDTQVAGTVAAYQTEAVFETIVAAVTQGVTPSIPQQPSEAAGATTQATSAITASPTPTSTSTSTPTSTNTPTSTPTETSTPTSTKTPVPPTATSTPLPCNWADLIKDVTIPDGTVLYPGTVFIKTWRFKNIGTCSWSKDYKIEFSDGKQMGAPDSKRLGVTVNSGNTIDISLQMTAPSDTGTYKGEWVFRDDDDDKFGVGSAKGSFWVSIKVENRPDFDSDDKLEFTKNVKAVTWKSQEGKLTPGSDYNFDIGSVSVVTKPVLEKGYQENETAIVMVPDEGNDGQVWGRYPGITIKDGDTFKTVLGCISTYTECDVTFILEAKVDGADAITLGTWNEKYDDTWTKVNMDLSAYDGKKLEFIFIVKSKGNSEDDAAFWLRPRIVR